MIMPFCEGGNIYIEEGATIAHDRMWRKELVQRFTPYIISIIRKKVIKGVVFKALIQTATRLPAVLLGSFAS